jgi:NAD+ kinase
VHATTFGDRLVAKFGLPVRGFRDARQPAGAGHHAGPGHELYPSHNVLTRDILNGDGSVAAVEGVGGAGPHDDD